MAGTAFIFPVGGFWPMGLVTVAAPGTTVPVNINVGAQKGAAGQTQRFSQRCRQFTFSTPGPNATAPNTKAIYICKKGYNRTQTNGVLLILEPGQNKSLPDGNLLSGASVAPDDLVVDSDGPNNSVIVVGIYG